PAYGPGRGAWFVTRDHEGPLGREWIAAPGQPRCNDTKPTRALDEHFASDGPAAGSFDGRQHGHQRTAGREDVIHEQDPLPGLDAEAPPELTMDVSVRGANLFSKDATHAELASGLERQDDTASRGAGHHVDAPDPVVRLVASG